MIHFTEHLISSNQSPRESLIKLNKLGADAILFVVDEDGRLKGSLTDGDIRRGFINGLDFNSPLLEFVQKEPKFIRQANYNLAEIIQLREKHYLIFPIIDDTEKVINVINFRYQKSYLPVDALIMAGGRGERLKPLTDNKPKPMLVIGQKPIIEHNIDRLYAHGIDDIWISVRYLGEQIEEYFKDGSEKSLRIQYVHENEPLGTIGALALIDNLVHDTILVMNSDLLTNIDFEDFYLFFKEQQADMAIASIPYTVNVPFAVFETDNHTITGLKEKPTYTHYSNAGIYLIKKSAISQIPKSEAFNATDLIELLITKKKKVVSYNLIGYWLDIGRHDDYSKAQEDIKHIKL
jgi:dTDP-glucose pyrophosphorylase